MSSSFPELVKQTTSRHGEFSQAHLLVSLNWLAHERYAFLNSGDDTNAVGVARLVQNIYRRQGVAPQVAQPPIVHDQAHQTTRYSRSAFEQRYGAAVKAVRNELVSLADFTPSSARTLEMYMYALTPQGEFRVWTRAFAASHLILGRSTAQIDNVPVAHPLLVSDVLEVVAAGELAVIESGGYVSIIVNLKSGHFRPPAGRAHLVAKAAKSILGEKCRSVDIFVMPAVNPAVDS